MSNAINTAAIATLRNVADVVEIDHVRGLVALDDLCTRFGAFLHLTASPLTDPRCATKEGTYGVISDLMLRIQITF